MLSSSPLEQNVITRYEQKQEQSLSLKKNLYHPWTQWNGSGGGVGREGLSLIKYP